MTDYHCQPPKDADEASCPVLSGCGVSLLGAGEAGGAGNS